MNSSDAVISLQERFGFWLLFFVIAFGLGYPVLNRYLPPSIAGLSDAGDYAVIVEGDKPAPDDVHRKFRVLVPLMARPIKNAAAGRIGTWDSTQFAMLVVNAVFCAGTALLIVMTAARLFGTGVGPLAATLYLLSFNVANFQLAGLVDSVEFFALALSVWWLVCGKWRLLPLLAIFAAGKETFPLIATTIAACWWMMELPYKGFRISAVVSILGLLLGGLATVSLLHTWIDGQWIWPWQIAGQIHIDQPFWPNFFNGLFERSVLLTFAFLLPLGVWRLNQFPRQWLVAVAVASAVVLAMGAWGNASANIANISRPLFGVLGPLLSISAARLLANR